MLNLASRKHLLLTILVLTISNALAGTTDKELAFGVLRGDGVITDVLYYRNGSWQEINRRKALSISSWYRVLADHKTPLARPTGVREMGPEGDCNSIDWAIQTDTASSGPAKNESLVWVSNRPEGFTWHPFENAAFVLTFADDARRSRVKEVPIALEHLAQRIKNRWFELEWSLLSKTVTQESKATLRNKIIDSKYLHFAIERATWVGNKVTLLQFNAMKIFHSPLIPERLLYDGANLFIDYSAWAVVYPDGKVAWLSESINLMKSGENDVKDYKSIQPLALLTLDNHFYLVTQSDDEMGKGVTPNKEVFEFVNGNLVSRRRYLGAC